MKSTRKERNLRLSRENYTVQTQLRAAEEDVEAQRQELMAGFDQIPYARENTSLERKLTT